MPVCGSTEAHMGLFIKYDMLVGPVCIKLCSALLDYFDCISLYHKKTTYESTEANSGHHGIVISGTFSRPSIFFPNILLGFLMLQFHVYLLQLDFFSTKK